VYKAYRDLKVHRDYKAFKGCKDLKVHRGFKDYKDN
jgi:hypothetical protein